MSIETVWQGKYHGYRCALRKREFEEPINTPLAFWLGYVILMDDHPWNGMGYDDIPARVHGGLTYADRDPAGYTIGFDCRIGAEYNEAYMHEELCFLAEQVKMAHVSAKLIAIKFDAAGVSRFNDQHLQAVWEMLERKRDYKHALYRIVVRECLRRGITIAQEQ